MSIKTQAYMRKLRKYLKVDDLKNLSAEQLERFNKFVADHPDPEVLADLIAEMGGGNSFKVSIINTMGNILRDIMNSGAKDISKLQEIMNQTATILEKNDLNKDDRQEIHFLLKEFAQILREKMLRNDQIRVVIVGSVFTVVFLIAGGVIWSKLKLNSLALKTLQPTGTVNLINSKGIL